MSDRLSPFEKAALAARLWQGFFAVQFALRRYPLPKAIQALKSRQPARTSHLDAVRLGRIVARVLRLGHYHSRCLVRALVLYRLLHEQGDPAEVVIGLPADAVNHNAHAWVEVEGREVGPPPGRHGHEELVRYA